MEQQIEKPKMITLKEQIQRDYSRKMVKLMKRMKKRNGMPKRVTPPQIKLGNKDSGIPFRGKDTFSGQLKKFNDRIWEDVIEKDGKDVKVTRLMVYDNNKYDRNGKVRE